MRARIIHEYVDDVSIVIPTYNRCLYPNDERNPLMWCISSINQQTYEGIEIIVVDDASTDKTYMKMIQKRDEDLNARALK